MKGANALVVSMIMIMLVAAFVPLAVGEDDSLHVVMTVEDREYSVGNNIVVELRVYDKGALVNADGDNDTVEVTMTRNWHWNDYIEMDLTNIATGIYQGTYTIGSHDADEDDDNLYFYYHVVRGDPPNQDEEEITHHNHAVHIGIAEQEFTVDVSFDGQSGIVAHPGDTVTATIRARLGLAYVGDSAIDGIMIEDPDGNTQNLTATFITTGVCRVAYTIPATLKSGIYKLIANPSIAGHAEGSADIIVNVLDVWYHKLSSTGETVSFEVCVADLEGQPVNGANVLIRRGGDTLTGTTNDTGKALMTLTNVVDYAGITGHVLSGGYNQSIDGAVFNPRLDEPGHNLDIIWNGNDYTFEAGQSVSIPYTAFMDEVPMNGQAIHYYVTAQGTDYGISPIMEISDGGHVDAPYTVVSAGTATTSTIGQFTISFIAPTTQSYLSVRFEVPRETNSNAYDRNDGLHYEVWGDGWNEGEGMSFYVTQGNMNDDPDVKVSADKFKPGQENSVKVTMGVGSFDEVTALWGVGEYDMENPEVMDPEWFCWVFGGNVISLSESAEGEYTGTYTVPGFLDNEDTITIFGGYMDDNTGFPHYNSKEIARDTGGISTLIIIGIIVVLVVVVLVIYLIKR